MSESPELYEMLIYAGASLIGLISCFYGYRLFKLLVVSLVALAGAAGLAWAGFQYGEQPVLWAVGGLIIGSILGGIMAMFFYRLAVGLIAALFVAVTLLPWVQSLEVWIQVLSIGGACLIAAFVATALTNLMIQLASAMLGALLIVHSTMYFVTGETVYRTTEADNGWVLNLDLDLTLAGAALVLGLIGFFVQRRSAK